MKLFIAIPCKKEINAKFLNSLMETLGHLTRQGITPQIHFLPGFTSLDQARSILATQFYRKYEDNDMMIFIDSDHVFQYTDILTAIKVGGDVTCGIYSNALGMPTFFPFNYTDFVTGKTTEIRYGATGFMLIRRPILDKLSKLDCCKPADIEVGAGTETGSEKIGPFRSVIPFFKQQIVDSELMRVKNQTTKDWLGEDYSFCHLVRSNGGSVRGFFSKTLGHEVSRVQVFQPASATIQKGIHYFCGRSNVKFSPLNTNLGGSEQAVVQLAKRWRKSNPDIPVTVYGNVVEGVYDGVVYRPVDAFTNGFYETVILWRGFGLSILSQVNASKLLVDLHDATIAQMLPPELLGRIDRIMVKSNWHRTNWQYIPDDQFQTIPNGIQVDVFNQIKLEEIQREPFRICYTSCYTRGLIPMLEKLWPLIIEKIPEATLHIYYGYDGVKDPVQREKIETALKTAKNIYDHGRVNLDEIAREKFRSTLHLYICNTPVTETDCISVRESVYAGCVPVVCNEGVFKERYAMKIDKLHTDADIYNVTADRVIQLLTTNRYELEEFLKNAPPDLSWDSVAEQWLTLMS